MAQRKRCAPDDAHRLASLASFRTSQGTGSDAVGERIAHHVHMGQHFRARLGLCRGFLGDQLLNLGDVMAGMDLQQFHQRVFGKMRIGGAQEGRDLFGVGGEVVGGDALGLRVLGYRGVEIGFDRAVMARKQGKQLVARGLAIKRRDRIGDVMRIGDDAGFRRLLARRVVGDFGHHEFADGIGEAAPQFAKGGAGGQQLGRGGRFGGGGMAMRRLGGGRRRTDEK
jgi:hypothetical protein